MSSKCEVCVSIAKLVKGTEEQVEVVRQSTKQSAPIDADRVNALRSMCYERIVSLIRKGAKS